ncbi:MAG: hypothetical protein EOP50_17420 [Sphingobacteriales bacterium]|nr:MAG: hypothetical protein EOP50_17420 [Sphingobacteriales bacterium]
MVDALQEVVTKSHAKLDAISGQLEEAERVSEREGRDSRHNLLPVPDVDEVKHALNDLEAAYEALLSLKHHKNRLRYTAR